MSQKYDGKYVRTVLSLVIATLIGSAQAHSQEKESLPVAIEYTDSGEALFKFADGRVATYFGKLSEIVEAPVRLELLDSTCATEISATTCEVTTISDTFQVSLLWKDHPDPEKIMTPVLKKYSLEDDTFDTIYDNYTIRELSGEDGYETIFKCNNYDFIGGEFSDSFLISQWSGERNATNEFTGLSENQAFLSISDIILVKKDTEFLITNVNVPPAPLYNILNTFVTTLTGTRSTWAVYQENGSYCQVTFEPDVSDIIRVRAEQLAHNSALPFEPFTISNFEKFHTEDLGIQMTYGEFDVEAYFEEKNADDYPWRREVPHDWMLLDLNRIISLSCHFCDESEQKKPEVTNRDHLLELFQ